MVSEKPVLEDIKFLQKTKEEKVSKEKLTEWSIEEQGIVNISGEKRIMPDFY